MNKEDILGLYSLRKFCREQNIPLFHYNRELTKEEAEFAKQNYDSWEREKTERLMKKRHHLSTMG